MRWRCSWSPTAWWPRSPRPGSVMRRPTCSISSLRRPSWPRPPETDDDEDSHRPQPLPADGTQRRERSSSIRSRPPCPPAATRSPCSSGIARRSPAGRRCGVPHCRLACYGVRIRGGRSLKSLVEFRPDVVHVHNTFPLVTPSVLYACRDAGVPVVATMHNYKLGCASGDVLSRWPGLPRLPRVDPHFQRWPTAAIAARAAATAPVVLGSWLHRSGVADHDHGLHLHLRCSTGPARPGRASR